MAPMRHPAFDPALAVDYLTGRRDPKPVVQHAAALRDEGHGRTVTFSKKVFIPVTTLCRDRCSYCTFAKPPGAGGAYLEPEEVLAVAQAGERAGCTEALLTLGDRPEDRWRQAREFLHAHDARSTIDYVRQMSELVIAETSLFPHANPGVMTRESVRLLRPTNVSMGLMLENVSDRLTEPGMPHHGSPDKVPEVRLETLRAAGEERVPFTTGVLVGIGETAEEIVDSLIALWEIHRAYGGIQEIIVQNFRAKADTPMRHRDEPSPRRVATVAAVARWLFGPLANIQVPPNLTERFEEYLDAGINDWGGVSPVTIDWVNPERPWPHLDELRGRTEAAGFRLRPRLPVYPEFIDSTWLDPSLFGRVRNAAERLAA